MARFDLREFLARTGVSLSRLASYLRVAPSYLEAALDGTGRLTKRDEQACRLLVRRLFKAKQMDLPFAEPRRSFTKTHARDRARAAAKTGASLRSKPKRKSPTPRQRKPGSAQDQGE
jgi:hypothetical protein